VSWDAIPQEVRAAALAVCTPEEIDVMRLSAIGFGYRKIGRALGIDRDTARNRLERASRKIRDHLAKEAACPD